MGDAVYRPQNILLTGGAGFIGSHVATLLCTRYPQYKVRASRLVASSSSRL
jgi:nucleoside-diphosphate-sugar epimerase